MTPDVRDPPFPGGDREVNQAAQQTIEQLIDEIGEQSFPASDPPAWGAVASRSERARRDAPAESARE